MIDDNRVYVIQGRNLNLILTLLDDLKEVALDYAELVGDDLEMVDNKFEKLIDEIKSSEIFEDLNLENYDHVIMNPPFHKGKKFVHSLVSIFLKKAKKILAKNGTLWMVYKKELQYEFVINDMFQNFECIYINKGYRIIRAIKRY